MSRSVDPAVIAAEAIHDNMARRVEGFASSRHASAHTLVDAYAVILNAVELSHRLGHAAGVGESLRSSK